MCHNRLFGVRGVGHGEHAAGLPRMHVGNGNQREQLLRQVHAYAHPFFAHNTTAPRAQNYTSHTPKKHRHVIVAAVLVVVPIPFHFRGGSDSSNINSCSGRKQMPLHVPPEQVLAYLLDCGYNGHYANHHRYKTRDGQQH